MVNRYNGSRFRRELLAYIFVYSIIITVIILIMLTFAAVIVRRFDAAHCRLEAARLFDKLGYADHYMKTIKSGNRWEQALAAERLGHVRCARSLPLLV